MSEKLYEEKIKDLYDEITDLRVKHNDSLIELKFEIKKIVKDEKLYEQIRELIDEKLIGKGGRG